MGQQRDVSVLLLMGAVGLALLLWLETAYLNEAPPESVPYSEFQALLKKGELDHVVISGDRLTATRTAPAEGKAKQVSTIRVDPALADQLDRVHVTFSATPGPGWFAALLAWLLPMFGLMAFWYFMMRPGVGPGGVMAASKSHAKLFVENEVNVRFSDVAGVDEAKEELQEVVEFLRNPQAYGRLGAHIPKGVLLVGPPGTGKTLLARAVAGEAGVPFFSISGSAFVELFVGVGAARVRDLFEQARAQAPSIIFIDELDALGRARSGLVVGAHEEKEQTLNQLLAEMDGFDPSSGVVLLAATNRPEILDPALLRAGRFDRQVLVDRPDRTGRIDIIRVHIKRIKLDPTVRIEDIAALTPGFTGADLANLINEAALLATRRKASMVGMADFSQAIERIIAGLEKHHRLLNLHEREVVAHHEMGHALVAMALPGTDKVQKISIIPHGIGALGYTIQRPTEDRFVMDRSELVNRMTVLLGGRASEKLIFGEISTGAADDLVHATDIARSMVVRYGMDPKLGQVAYEPQQSRMLDLPAGADWQPRRYGEATASAIDKAIHDLLEAAFARAGTILTANEALLRRAAAQLLQTETLTGPELETIAAQVKPAADARKAAE
ncbi:MAG TPA: ATP-dependent zinc metalloprotease FtsH [Acetobacteraceae bacterium]|nr:ATP-dependent zinc metalloprotease FtsH [Acetobacteraceae bacterium]